jgi:hypothetical protein
LNSISDDWNKETTTIMQLIKENLVLWMANQGITVEDHDDGEGEEFGGEFTEI